MNHIPSRREIAQQQRRARERKRREHERERERESEPHLKPRAIAQQKRRARERAEIHSSVSNKRHNLGQMDVECVYCGALHWLDERITNSSQSRPIFGTCCLQGKVRLPLLCDPPPFLRELFEAQDEYSKEFRCNIRQYNASHAFTSLGVNIDKSILNGHGPYCFRINGELCHYMGSLLPESPENAVYAQLYIHDPNMAHHVRMEKNKNLTAHIMWKIQELLRENHAFYPLYQQAHEILQTRRMVDLTIHLHFKKSTDRRRYNLPTANEVAVIIPGDGLMPEAMRDIVLRLRGDGALQRIHEGHPAYLPLHYVLLFPYGELGWHAELNHTLIDSNGQPLDVQDNASRLTQKEFYSFRLFPRRNEFSTILHGGKLLQEFMVDAWAATEQNRLRYLRINQNTLRADLYQGLADVAGNIANKELSFNNLGRRIILPSSHIGSARQMFEVFQDSMAITRFYHHPDIFGTMTANPNWPEITNALLPGQTASDRPDLIARVFNLKRHALLNDIKKNHYLGNAVAHVYTIEFQKRGLPHMHFLIFLHIDDKIKEPADVDRLVCAEFPDQQTDPALFETVFKCMVHGPCGFRNPQAPCMVNGKCEKSYPKTFRDVTSMDTDGYPLYARKDDGRTFNIRGKTVDNRDVVPYNPNLSRKYDCHINIEVCASVRAVKYIHKYIYKGHDRTTMQFGHEPDEIKQYIDARYIGASEAAWRLFGMNMHEEVPNVVRLALHLPGMHMVIFDPADDASTILARADRQKTTLTAFFEACKTFEFARCYTYQEFPQHFVWNKSTKKWTPRKQGFAIGRLYFADPSAGERFYLRLLLTVVRGPQSFDHLKTVGDVVHPTFKSACLALGLLEDDGEWTQCLEEAVIMHTGSQLRTLFAIILTQCAPIHPEELWSRFRMNLCDDLQHRLRIEYAIDEPTENQIFDFGLFLLDKILYQHHKSLRMFPSMPLWERNWENCSGNRVIAEQLAWNHQELQNIADSRISQLNNEQMAAYNDVINSVTGQQGKLFFLNGPAGTGKTFVYNALAMKIRSQGKIVLCVASSGIAALLLSLGRTAHSRFKIPLNLNETSFCAIDKNSVDADLIRQTSLIIWDEVPMQHRYCAETVDRSLRDIRNDERLFGGITVVFGGDFRQILPVIVRGSREEIVAASLRRSHLWQHIKVLALKKNMRLNAESEENKHFAHWLLEVDMFFKNKH